MQIDRFLTAKNNLEIIVGLIAKPHEFDSRVKWEPIPTEEWDNPLITWDLYKRSFIDINKQVTLKNIYWSFKSVLSLHKLLPDTVN